MFEEGNDFSHISPIKLILCHVILAWIRCFLGVVLARLGILPYSPFRGVGCGLEVDLRFPRGEGVRVELSGGACWRERWREVGKTRGTLGQILYERALEAC